MGAPVVTYSDVAGGWPGRGNFDGDPLFADLAGGDYHLLDGSPCVNVGNGYAPYLPDTDLDGLPRVQQCRIDVGAYETPYPPPLFVDCNSNGWHDDCDIHEGASVDCDQNHAPDECGIPPCDPDDADCTDCDNNGVPDVCDLVYGWGADCNLNGIFDVCEVPRPCAGDLDADCDVDLRDLATLLGSYGIAAGAAYGDGDLNGDRRVGQTDLTLLLLNYGTSCE